MFIPGLSTCHAPQASTCTWTSVFYLTVLSCVSGLVVTSPASALPSATPSAPVPAWYHHHTHSVHKLFRRVDALPAVGSDAWASAYPPGVYDLSKTPQTWLDALSNADSAGLIPDVPVSTVPSGQSPIYPNQRDPTSQDICSSTYQCRAIEDVWDAPDGHIGIGFDDGPLLPSPALYNFLKNNSQLATHFMIGLNVLYNPDAFLEAFNNGNDIAVHTWTHPYMTSLSNEAIVSELGYTMQIIHDSTGGRVPRFWRPPFGDADNRVRAIAKNIFGLTMVIWNQDTADWSLTLGRTSQERVSQQLQQFINGPKSPGLIILEHELSDQSVQCFMDAYPRMGVAGWNTTSVTRLVSAYNGHIGQTYWNAPNGNSNISILVEDILSGPSAQAAISASSSLSLSTPSGVSTSQLAQATGVRSGTGASRPQRLFSTLGYLVAIVSATSIGAQLWGV